jgi:type I restriction enzyme M protein
MNTSTNPLTRADLNEFVELYQSGNRHQRQATWSPETTEGRWRAYSYDDLVARDKVYLDIFGSKTTRWQIATTCPRWA